MMTKSLFPIRTIIMLALMFISLFLSIIFGKYALSLYYCLIIILTLSKPLLVEIYDIFAVSIVFDIYNNCFIGTTFMQCLLLYIFIIRLRSLFLNLRIFHGICCFCIVLIIPEFCCYFFTLVSGNNFDLLYHLKIIIVSTCFFGIYCFATIIQRKMNKRYV